MAWTAALALVGATSLAAADGPVFPILRAREAPALDGLLDPVWADAELASFGVDIYRVTFRALHDGRTLYLAFEDLTNKAVEGHDEFWLFLDEEGGAPPRRWDALWGADACDDDYPEEEEEGGFGWLYDTGYAIDEVWWQIVQAGSCLKQNDVSFSHAAVWLEAPNEHLVGEMAVPLSSWATPLGLAPGDEAGLFVQIVDDVNLIGTWPEDTGFLAPASFARARLATLGCNVPEGSTFDAGFPLDWTRARELGSVDWTLTGGGGGCGLSNVTGGTAEAACFRRTGTGQLVALLESPPVSLAAADSAELRFRAVYQDGTGTQFGVQASADGESWETLLQWDESHAAPGGPGEQVVLPVPKSYLGATRFYVRFVLGDVLNLTGPFVQVDDVTLTCGPLLFRDGFETGFTTHWSAEAS